MPAVEQRVEVNHPVYAPDNERDVVQKVVACVEAFENGMGIDFRERFLEHYRLYRGFQAFRDAWIKSPENDRDEVLRDAKRTWGAHLHIPLTFRTIETMVPRAIAHRPRMLYLPRDERWEQNVENVRLLIDAQQEQIDVELEYQDVTRNGMIGGLGVAKTFWRREYSRRRRAKRGILRPWYLGPAQMELAFDDPDFECVDPLAFGWDQYGHNIRSCSHVFQRLFLSTDACRERISSGAWNTQTAKALDERKLRELGGSMQKYDDIHRDRLEASGFQRTDWTTRGEIVHELIEWHDGEQVHSVLDRTHLVQDAENQCFGRIPFQVYRPTKLPGQMVGIGEVEPVKHLQRELDTLRSQRRDAATLALAAGYAYDDSAIDEEDLEFGPNVAIPVRNARVQDAIMPLARQDVPGTAYQDEQIVRGDFDTVAGVNDGLGENGGQIGTATEAQLVQAAVSKRVELKSRRFEVEVVRQSARCFLLLNQRMILSQRRPIRQPAEGLSMEEAAAEGRWQWFPIGPGELRGEFEIIPEGGSMAAENIPQKRQDGVQIMQLFDHPSIDPKRRILKALQLFDIKDPESWLRQSDPPVPPEALKVLSEMGVRPELIQHALQEAQRRDPRLQDGPDVQQVDQMMGAGQGAEEAMAA